MIPTATSAPVFTFMESVSSAESCGICRFPVSFLTNHEGEIMFGRYAARFCALTTALLMMGTLTAVSAQGAEFHSEVKETFSLGNQVTENVFTVSGGTVKCKKVSFEGAGSGTEKSAGNFVKPTGGAHPVYSECTAFGQAATVTTAGCNLRSDQPNAELIATVAIVCEAGKSMTVKLNAAACTVTIKAQEKKSRIKLKNEGAGATRDLLVTAEVEKLSYTSSGGVCGASGENGKYTGTATVKGYSDAAHTKQIGVWVE